MTQLTLTRTRSYKSADYGERSLARLETELRRERKANCQRLRRGAHGILVSSIGTDGVDGPTNAAGAVADGNTVDRGLRIHMDPDSYLRENNSYPFFERLRDLVITGPTGTNVNDIFIALVGPGSQKNGTARRSRGR